MVVHVYVSMCVGVGGRRNAGENCHIQNHCLKLLKPTNPNQQQQDRLGASTPECPTPDNVLFQKSSQLLLLPDANKVLVDYQFVFVTQTPVTKELDKK